MFVVKHLSGRTITANDGVLVVDGDVEKKVVYQEYGGSEDVGGGFSPGAGFGGGVVGGGRRYEIFAPSQPQAVNQYVHEYNYNPQPDVPQPNCDYLLALQQYKDASAREYTIAVL